MFCPNCACQLPDVARFCVKCGKRIEVLATPTPLPPRALASSCTKCGGKIDAQDQFCSHCGREVIHPQTEIASTAGTIAAKHFAKHAEHYRSVSDDELIRLSNEWDQLTDVAQKALVIEIAKRGLQGQPQGPGCASPSQPAMPLKPALNETSADWDYRNMADNDLGQLSEAYQKLRQPIPDSLKKELARRALRQMPTSAAVMQVGQAANLIDNAPAGPDAIATGKVATDLLIKTASPPYAKYVIHFLLACTSASIGVFAIFNANAKNSTSLILEISSLCLTLVFVWLGSQTWKDIVNSEPKRDPKLRKRQKNVLVISVILAVLYFALAGLLGMVIGKSSAEAIQMRSDQAAQEELADRITKARTSDSASIPSLLEMYRTIEPDVTEYTRVLSRLKEDLRKFGEKFPAQDQSTKKYIASIDREVRRSNLITKQIELARRIQSLDTEQQSLVWRRDMVPLLDQEDALDSDK